MPNYPRRVNDVLCDRKYPGKILRVMKWFRSQHPFRKTRHEKLALFTELVNRLNEAYGFVPCYVMMGPEDRYEAFVNSDEPHGVIQLDFERMSVVSLLHEYSHHRQHCQRSHDVADEREACSWSINLFRRIFPKSYSKLKHQGHLLVRREGN